MKIRAAVGVATLVVGLGVTGVAIAPLASADENQYIYDINQGIGAVESNRGDWLRLGYAVCGMDLANATNYIYSNTGGNTDRSESQFAAESAFMFLC